MAEALNNHFSNIGKNLADKFEATSCIHQNAICVYRVTPVMNRFTLPDALKIEAACKGLDPFEDCWTG